MSWLMLAQASHDAVQASGYPGVHSYLYNTDPQERA